MGERAPAFAEVVRRLVAARLVDLHTAIPGRIVKYDAGTQKADVKPLVKQAYLDEEGARQVDGLPVVPGVPVMFPGGGGYRLTFPVRAGDRDGDTCLLVFSQASLDRWLSGNGAEVDPEIDGATLSDAVAILGLKPFGAPLSSAPTDEATLGSDDGVQVHLEENLITAGDKSGSEFVALADKLLQRVQDIETKFDAHVHTFTGTVAGAACSGTTTATATPTAHSPDFAATQFKAK